MRHYKVEITARAIVQIQTAIDYYNNLQNGLGKRFYQDLQHQLSSIRKHPFSRAIRYDVVRFAVLDKFPYAAHFTIEENVIVIQRVLTMNQDPETSWIGNT